MKVIEGARTRQLRLKFAVALASWSSLTTDCPPLLIHKT